MTLVNRNALLAASVLASAGSCLAAVQYQITPLASFGTPDVFVGGINNSGQVVGHTVDASGASQAVIWDSTGGHALVGNAGAPLGSEAYRINDAGQIAGKARAANGNFHAALWSSGTITDIGTVGGATSFAMDVNEAGVVCGSSAATPGTHAFTWTPAGGFVDYGNTLPTSPLGQAGFNGINDNGLMVGTAYVIFSPYKASLAHVGDRGVTQISPPGQFSNGMALAVNDAGTIVGWQNPNGSGTPVASIFHGDGTATPLGSFGLSDSWAMDINDDGVIVGKAFGDDGTGNFISKSFIYQDGTMTNLFDQLINPAGWTGLLEATTLNDLGQIAGVGNFNGELRGFVLSPVPEPAAATILACAGMMLRRKR